MNYKFKINDLVWVHFPSSDRPPCKMRILEQVRVKDQPFYKLDWTITGRSHLLNAVSVSEKVLHHETSDQRDSRSIEFSEI